MSDNDTKIKESWEKPFRPKGIAITAMIFVVCLIYMKFGLDSTLKFELEKVASESNGSKVDIGSLKTNFFLSQVTIEALQIANHTEPKRNLLQIDHLSFHYGLDPLLRKKIVLKDLKVEGIHYGTARSQSGVLVQEEEQDGRISLLDRVASGMYSEMRNKLNDNPLKQLGSLLTGSNIHDDLYDMQSKLKSTKFLNELRQKIEHSYQAWGQQQNTILSMRDISEMEHVVDSLSRSGNFDDLRPIESKISEKIVALQGVTKTINDDGNTFRRELNDVDRYLNEDVATLRDQLKLPGLDNTDLSNQVFGPTLLNYLERVSYWVDLSRRTMFKGSRNDLLVTIDTDHEGTDVHFGKMAAYPAFILFDGTFLSDLSADPTKGKIQGSLSGLTSDPPIYGKPTVMNVEGTFPGLGLEGIKMSFFVDHTQDFYREHLVTSIENFPVENLILVESGDLKLGIDRARGQFKFQADFADNELKAHLTGSLWNIEYHVVSRFQRIEDAIKQATNLSSTFDIDAEIEGPLDKLQLTTKSKLGERLAWEIQSEFKHQVGAIEDDIRKYILDTIYPKKEDLGSTFKRLSDTALASTDEQIKRLEDLQQKAVQKVAKTDPGSRMKRQPSSN